MLDWTEAAAAGEAISGGKAWNLGRLHRDGFPVPTGGVLVAEAYRLLLGDRSVRPLIDEAAAIGAGEATSPEVVHLLGAMRRAIEESAIAPAVRFEVEGFLTKAGLAEKAVAVRSSATAEDGAEHSFAGMHRSFLDVRGMPAVMKAIRGCYASLWTPQAVAYRRHRGVCDDDVACAVVLCAMLEPTAAGVAFTCDPRNGRRDLITISAAWGTGEAVVSGSVTPEDIAVRGDEVSLSLHSREGSGPVLSEEQALAVARLAKRVHWALGDGQEPQDVEWAWDSEGVWLLQARPVTSLPIVTFPGAEALPVIWSSANVQEAVPGVQSTLSWSLLKPAISRFLHSHLELAGHAVPSGMEVLRRFSGRAFFDLTRLQWAVYDALGQTPAEFIRGIGGHQPQIPVPSSDPLRGAEGRRRLLARLRLMRGLRQQMKALPAHITDFRLAMRKSCADDLSGMTGTELLARFVERSRLADDFGFRFQAANINAGLWTTMLTDSLSRVAPERAPVITNAILAGSGSVTTAEQGYRLYDLAAAARSDEAALAYLRRGPLDSPGWKQLPAGSPFRREFERFLDEFGHRAVYEAEIANARWREEPAYLLEQVKYLAENGKTKAPREMARATRAAGDAELARLPWHARAPVRWLARKARRGATLREEAKSAFASLAEPGRREFLEIGRRLSGAGRLDAPSDVFHLSWADVETYLRGEWDGSGARNLVADRKRRDAEWLAEEPAAVYVIDAENRPAAIPRGGGAVAGNVLTGIGVAAGRAGGAACVIRHPREGHLLGDGDVLVAPSTDPGWTPLFLRASAVVTEVGGYLSHGAIVAREYGLPAVVNVEHLMHRVRTGQHLTVDGDAGTVSVSPGVRRIE